MVIRLILGILILVSVFGYLLIGEILTKLILRRRSVAKRIMKYQMDSMKNLYKIDFEWWENYEFEKRKIKTFDNLNLYPLFYKNGNSTKTAVIIHGYFARYQEMQQYAKMFMEMGFNLVITQNRAHYESEGKYVGMGWLDRLDVLEILKETNLYFGKECEIVLFGLSMGASTVCMASGESLPENVTHLIADCGYDSAYNEFLSVAKKFTKLPLKPVMAIFSSYAKLRCGYSLKEADALKMLAKNKKPILFIHGEDDNFVDFSMQEKLYNATNKNLAKKVSFKKAGHAECLPLNLEKYKKVITQFLEKK